MKLTFVFVSDPTSTFELEVSKHFSLPVFRALIVSFLDLKVMQHDCIQLEPHSLGHFVITSHRTLHQAFIKHTLSTLMDFYNTQSIHKQNDFFL